MKPNWMNDFGVPPTYEQKSNIESILGKSYYFINSNNIIFTIYSYFL